MRVETKDVISIVEAAYTLDAKQTPEAWLGNVLAAATPHLGDGNGVLACLYDRSRTNQAEIAHSFVLHGVDPRLLGEVRDYFEQGSDARQAWVWDDTNPIRFLADSCEVPVQQHPRFGALARGLGVHDVVAIRAANLDRTGVFVGAYLANRPRKQSAWVRQWTRIVAHVAAGRRLHRATRETLVERAEAVLAPHGRVLSANGPAIAHRERLHEATRAIDRSRSRLRKRDPQAALDAWAALVDGRWSLIEHFESDGRRVVLALPNAPGMTDPRGLVPDERTVLALLTIGHSNKRIAYELGLPEGTIARRVSRIARKLGVTSRVRIIDRWNAIRGADIADVDLDGDRWMVAINAPIKKAALETLTTAEREVARLAARGMSNKEIAARRGSAVRTVENLLSSAYRRLGVMSRAELALRLDEG